MQHDASRSLDQVSDSESYIFLQDAQSSLVSAQELLNVAQDRLILAKERVKFAQERKNLTADSLDIARQILAAGQRLLAGANELCRLSGIYVARAGLESSQDSDAVELAQNAHHLSTETDYILTVATGQVMRLQYQILSQERKIKAEQRRYQYEVGVWFNANELLNLAEDQLNLACQRVRRAEDRLVRAHDRVHRSASHSRRSRSSGTTDNQHRDIP